MSNMQTQTQTQTLDAWKDMASKATTGPPKAGATVQRMVNRMNELRPFSSACGIFDNGTGTGSIITHILNTYGTSIPDSTRIVAGDTSESMLDVLRNYQSTQSESSDAWKRLNVMIADAQDLSSCADGVVSHITAGHLYFLVPDADAALKETYRILCSGGVLGLSSGKEAAHGVALSKAMEVVRPGTNLRLIGESWASEEKVKDRLAKHGFVDIETELFEMSHGYQDHRSFAEMLLKMPVMKEKTSDFSDEEHGRLLVEVVKALKEVNPAEPGALTGTNILVIARKP